MDYRPAPSIVILGVGLQPMTGAESVELEAFVLLPLLEGSTHLPLVFAEVGGHVLYLGRLRHCPNSDLGLEHGHCH